ncbi:MAG: PilN domain-containing protein [Gammaproteobacteria bacterium]|nr:PilN domain-containing protein [Gammaproteobacteria bacterium]
MMPARIELDFGPGRRGTSLAGVLVLMAGIGVAYFTFSDYRDSLVESELLEMNIARYESRSNPPGSEKDTVKPAVVAAARARLGTPWSSLFDDLEAAGVDSAGEVALLEIAPDLEKGKVRISGEARTLVAALDYVARLQKAGSVQNPLLERHEVRVADRERPVEFVISATWRATL